MLLSGAAAYEEFSEQLVQQAATGLVQRIFGVVKNVAEDYFVGPVDKIASIGVFGERAAYMLTGTGSGYSMSPVESLVMVVGDPFFPKITGFAPVEGAAGDVVAISGQRFKDVPPAANTVRFGDTAGVTKTATETLPTVEVPADATPGDVTISVQTPAGRGESQATFKVLRKPVITGLTPTRGFPPKANFPTTGQNFPGTLVILEGSGFDPAADAVTFGGVLANNIKLDESFSTRLAVYVPSGAVTGFVKVTTPQGRKGTGPRSPCWERP